MMQAAWRRMLPALLVILAMVGWGYVQHQRVAAPASGTTATAATPSTLPSFLPAEAHDTLALIARGGPFPHAQDGVVFGNYEHLLPTEPRGYYHEFTVATPGARNRGARRIITGGAPPVVYYYTDDHYRSFHAFTVPR